MPMACADCGCLVEHGVRVSTCGTEGCCCGTLPTRQSLDGIAVQITAAFAERDMESFGRLLANDARWGDDDAPNRCHTRGEVIATFQRLLAEGVGGEITETMTGRAGILCHLRIDWPGPGESGRRNEVLHLYRVRDGQIVAIEPYDDRLAAETALASA
jgi:ketosteroid isomerase-like protein